MTLYLSEADVRKTLNEIKEHSAPGSILGMDLYDKKLTSMKGVKATKEMFGFSLDFTGDGDNVLKQFMTSENLAVGSYNFMSQKTKRGAYGVVLEVVV